MFRSSKCENNFTPKVCFPKPPEHFLFSFNKGTFWCFDLVRYGFVRRWFLHRTETGLCFLYFMLTFFSDLNKMIMIMTLYYNKEVIKKSKVVSSNLKTSYLIIPKFCFCQRRVCCLLSYYGLFVEHQMRKVL